MRRVTPGGISPSWRRDTMAALPVGYGAEHESRAQPPVKLRCPYVLDPFFGGPLDPAYRQLV
jgi:hypothetical protein